MGFIFLIRRRKILFAGAKDGIFNYRQHRASQRSLCSSLCWRCLRYLPFRSCLWSLTSPKAVIIPSFSSSLFGSWENLHFSWKVLVFDIPFGAVSKSQKRNWRLIDILFAGLFHEKLGLFLEKFYFFVSPFDAVGQRRNEISCK